MLGKSVAVAVVAVYFLVGSFHSLVVVAEKETHWTVERADRTLTLLRE